MMFIIESEANDDSEAEKRNQNLIKLFLALELASGFHVMQRNKLSLLFKLLWNQEYAI